MVNENSPILILLGEKDIYGILIILEFETLKISLMDRGIIFCLPFLRGTELID